MSQDVIVSSTTDTQEQVNAAAGVSEEAKPEVSEEETAEVEVSEPEKAETDSESETEPESEPETRPKADKKLLKRIDKLTARLYAAEEELKKTREIKVPEDKGAPTTQKPKQDDFKTWEEYNEALTSYNAEQAFAKQEAKAKEAAEEVSRKEVFDAYNQRVREVSEKYEDFAEVVGSADFKVPNSVVVTAYELENGPDLAYHLAKNPEICDELMKMSPVRAAAYAAQIAASLESGAPKPKPTSRAPKPIKPVAGGSTRSSVPLDQLDYQAYRKARDAQSQD